MELDPKFALFLEWPKNELILTIPSISIFFLKCTRKELSDDTLILKKNIIKIGGIEIENHTLSPKNIPPPVKMPTIHQKVQNG